jgi:uncharacterized protein YxjI
MPTLLEHDVVVVRQKAKIIEVTNQYFLEDADGNEIGWIVEEGQSWLRKLLRLVSRFDSFLPHRLGVADVDGHRVLGIYKPMSFLRSRVEVSDANDAPVGVIRQQNVLGKIRFSLEGAGGEPLGELRAENWRAWDFHVTDANGAEVARVTKKWAGILREGFTTADNYIFTVEPTVQGPLRLLCFACAAAIDSALKQNDK